MCDCVTECGLHYCNTQSEDCNCLHEAIFPAPIFLVTKVCMPLLQQCMHTHACLCGANNERMYMYMTNLYNQLQFLFIRIIERKLHLQGGITVSCLHTHNDTHTITVHVHLQTCRCFLLLELCIYMYIHMYMYIYMYMCSCIYYIHAYIN